MMHAFYTISIVIPDPLSKGLDKDKEFEADVVGVEYAYRAGYNPQGLEVYLQTLAQEELKNIQEATEVYLESLKAHDEPIPPPIDEEVIEVVV